MPLFRIYLGLSPLISITQILKHSQFEQFDIQ